MAVTITDTNRATWDQADSNTGWSALPVHSSGTVNTTDYAEATGSIVVACDTTSTFIKHTDTGTDLSSSLIYVWGANIAEQNSWKPGTLSDSPHCLFISDSTNDLCLLQAGNDREVFKHADTQVTFQCLVIDTEYVDTKNTAGEIYVDNGSVASFDNTSITEIGAYFTTNAKAHKGWNVAVDIIRTGAYADAVVVHGGTTGDRGTWLEFVEEDRSKSDGKALGVIREYTSGIYGCQGTIQLGITTASSYFEDSGFVVVWENRDVTDNAFRFYTAGYSSGTTLIAFSGGTFASAGPAVLFDASAANVSTLTFDACTFTDLKNAVSFPTDSTSNTHEIIGCTFNNCGQIDPGTVDFEDCAISNTNTTTTGAVLLDSDGTANWSGNSWVYGGGATEAAIEITSAGTYTFTDLAFTGYGATASNTAAIHNSSTGAVTILNDGSSGITYRNTGGSTTTVQSTVTTTVTVATATGTLIENARVFLQATDGTGPLPYEDTVTITSASTTASVAHTGHGLINGQQVAIRGAAQEEYNGVYAISNATTNAYDYTFAGSGTSPATGTIDSTGVLIHGLTSALGVISDTRSLGGNQPVTGHSRKSSGTPFYKSSSIVGTVDSSDGATFTAVMILDE